MLKLNLSPEQKDRLSAYLKADRQWKREHRLGYARLMLKYAHAKESHEDVTFYRAVVQANTL